MYAVVRSGGHQYKVEPGQTVRVDKLEAGVGEPVTLGEVLLVKDGETIKAGTPTVEGAKVETTVVAHGRGQKIIVFKKKRRTGYQKKQGHRQDYTALKIVSISL